MPTVSGPLEGGGTFSTRTRTHWAVEAALLASHHQTNWRLTDTASGRTGKVGAYRTAGLWLALSARF